MFVSVHLLSVCEMNVMEMGSLNFYFVIVGVIFCVVHWWIVGQVL
jgi:hypothetical protein